MKSSASTSFRTCCCSSTCRCFGPFASWRGSRCWRTLRLPYWVASACTPSLADCRKHWLAAPLVGLLATGLVLLEALPKPLATFPIPSDATLQNALQESAQGPTLLVPVSGKDEVWRMWMVTEGSVGPIVNGYSGHIWQQYWYFVDTTQKLIAGELEGLAAGLSAYGIRTIAVDLQQMGGASVLWEEFGRGPWVSRLQRVDSHLVIELAERTSLPADQWIDLEATVLLDAAQPASGFISTLVLRNPSADPWIPPGDARVRRLQMEWVRSDGSVELAYETDALPPPFLRPGQVHSVPVHQFSPPAHGSYVLRASADGERIFERTVQVKPISTWDFSGTADGMLAGLTLRTPARFVARPTELLPLHVDAHNIGQTRWVDEANVVWAGVGGRSARTGAKQNSPNTRAALSCLATSSTTFRQVSDMRLPATCERRTSPAATSYVFRC